MTIRAEGYSPRLETNHNTSENLNASMSSSTAVLTFNDAKTSLPLSFSDVTIYYPDSRTLDLTTNINGQVNFSILKESGLPDFGTYGFYFKGKQGYVTPINITDDIQQVDLPYEETFNISQASLDINIYDRSTLNLLAGPSVNVFIINLFNETTTNGTLSITDLTLVSGEYTIYAVSQNYSTERVTFTFTNQEVLSLDIYLQNLTGSIVSAFVSVTNERNYAEPGTLVIMKQYFPVNDSFIKVSECITNTIGECLFYVELGTQLYIFEGSKTIDGRLFTDATNSGGEFINVENDVIPLKLRTSDTFVVPVSDNLRVYDVVHQVGEYNTTHNSVNLSASFYTEDGTSESVCIAFFEIFPTHEEIIPGSEVCTTASSGNIGVNPYIIPNDDKIVSRIYQPIGESKYVFFEYYYVSKDSLIDILNDNNYIPPVILLIWLLLLAVSFKIKNLSVFFVGAIILSWVSNNYFGSYWSAALSVMMTMYSLMGLAISRRRGDIS